MRSRTRNRPHTAFTLIELAVTLAVLSILSLVAAPMVRDAITHARIANTKNNLRILRDGLEAYATDYGQYPTGSTSPSNSLVSDFDSSIVFRSLLGVYLPNNPSLLEDDFSRETMAAIKKSIALDLHSIPDVVGYSYFDYMNYHVPPWTPLNACAVVSVGPDAKDSGLGIAIRTPFTLSKTIYSPSNGVRSDGDIGVANAPLSAPLMQ
jgi:prepilin-type N-terminal cleavage/methylation domain-containing protein